MSSASLDASLDWLASKVSVEYLTLGLRGIEKECLRVAPDGRLAQTPHPASWGSPLTHPYLTTDYSEALVEFVTPPLPGISSTLEFLDELHAFVARRLDDESLWPASMPCIIDDDAAIPIARYGSSNEGRLRTIYRSGLGYRYGRSMQAIAGIHVNFSLHPSFWPIYQEYLASRLEPKDFRSDQLMGLIRNYRRISWLITYLFGASPAFCKSFRPDGHPRLQSLSDDTWFAPDSTSLRMSDMGYRNRTQSRLSIPVNSLREYLAELRRALTTREPRYDSIGVMVDGEYRQLNANLLQLENEYYSAIRPKPAEKSPRLIVALAETGIEYVEARTLDLNPFAVSGITAGQARLVELLLIECLLMPCPPISESEQEEIDRRELTVAWEGRRPGLEIERNGAGITLSAWALEILDDLDGLALFMDQGRGGDYGAAVADARQAVLDPGQTVSARVLAELRDCDGSFFSWAFDLAGRQKRYFQDFGLSEARFEALSEVARQSVAAAAECEARDQLPLDDFLANFLEVGSVSTADEPL
jgi:glutamate--cysteine ligase